MQNQTVLKNEDIYNIVTFKNFFNNRKILHGDLGNVVSFYQYSKSYLHIGKLIDFSYKDGKINFISIKIRGISTVIAYHENIFDVKIYDVKSYINWKLTSKQKILTEIDDYIESFLLGDNCGFIKSYIGRYY
tara:strand:+ start:14678 stop:15073 length:396 start_codon:yes stop_codon:yes gene_type:complete